MTVQSFSFADVGDVWAIQETSKHPVGACNLKNNTSDPTLLEPFEVQGSDNTAILINFGLFTVSGILLIFILDQFTRLGMLIRSKTG